MFSTQPDPNVGRLPPVTPLWIIVSSCVMGLWLNTLPIPLGIYALCPDFLLFVLVFWAVFEPTKMGILTAWFIGLFMDVIHGPLLSQHGLTYSFAVFLAILLKRRLFRFSPFYQSLHIMPIVFLGHSGAHWISNLHSNNMEYPFYLILGNIWIIPLWLIGCSWISLWRRNALHTID